MNRQLFLHDEECGRLQVVCERLVRSTNAGTVFVADTNGKLLAVAGGVDHLDTTTLATLAAGAIAATRSLASAVGEDQFSLLFHEGDRDHLHLSLLNGRAILAVLFGARSTLGLVRLRAKQAVEELDRIFEEPERKTPVQPGGGAGPFAEIVDGEFDNLFRG